MTTSTTSRTSRAPGVTGIGGAVNGSMFTRTLWDNRRIFPVWALAIGLLAMAYASFYPQVTADTMATVPEAMRGFGFEDATTPAGYLRGAVFGLLVPLLVTFYGAATGARMISADEESGYLDLLLAHPISRTRLLLHRFAALAVGALLIAAAVFAAMLAVRDSADLDAISVGQFAAQALNVALLGLLFGALATTIGAATGRSRGAVFGATSGLGVLAYALHGLAPQIGADWLRHLTPYHYYIDHQPLTNGMHTGDTAVLAGTTLALITAGAWRLNHRDLAR
ncbi:ABC transporter permease subunit [Phytohabitans sp. LJ34]|uniref:ABC transporter permease subunit n=1 Tax=Phytohabitans sp. LJ34 TaxID=3452217 RepID=UPI003F89C271